MTFPGYKKISAAALILIVGILAWAVLIFPVLSGAVAGTPP